ncbi:MAG: B12-binding domain-containing radical SAM protein [Candidatus Coatesbacteria bacterium]|nr:B12-binding domain-containing radical SAM protein [Candidatus Coatesbacteria bacterium]
MKVTLISPYLDVIALGIRGISSFLKANGHECELIFLPDHKSLLKDDPHFEERYPDGLMEDVVQACSESDVVGVSLMSNYFDRAAQITKSIKAELKAPVVWGGIHPTVIPDDCLNHCDIVCVGEGEYPMLNLVRAMEKKEDIRGIKGFFFKENGKVIRNELEPLLLDLDSLPFQDFDYVDHYTIGKDGKSLVRMDYEIQKDLFVNGLRLGKGLCFYQTMTTRGCPHACSYCCNYAFRKLFPGQKILRRRSDENVMQELELVKEKMPYIELIAFSDDSMTAVTEQVMKEFCEEYKRRIDLPFFVLVSPPTVTEKKCEYMVDAGMHVVEMGIQSGSDSTNKMYRRSISNEQVVRAAEILNIHRDRIYPPVYDVILDNPFEVRSDVLKTIRLLLELPQPYIIQFFSLTFYPGTELWDRARKEGIVEDAIENVYRKYYHEFKKSFLNFLVLAIHNRLPKPLIRILSNSTVAAILDSKPLKPFWKLAYRLLTGLKRLMGK